MFQNTITDVFFDLDHTLWDFDKNSELAFERIFKENYPNIETKTFIEVYAPINQACWKLYQIDKITHEELRYKRLKETFYELNYSITDDQIHQISEDYISFLPEYNLLFEGAIEVLEYLFDKYKLHIITNGFSQVQNKKIANSGLSDFFSTITNSEMAGVKKPHPSIYEYALNSATASKENSIMIGDCLQADIEGAMNFGIKAIFFNPEKKEVPLLVHSISNLSELKNLL
jgi:YjjG family noncanonical pyrimidine nucleotidase